MVLDKKNSGQRFRKYNKVQLELFLDHHSLSYLQNDLELANPQLKLVTQPSVAGAGGLVELQLRSYFQGGKVG